ncbi:MAG: TIGR00282 family metallophosphoesterase [Verrucomicrobiota bacterium]
MHFYIVQGACFDKNRWVIKILFLGDVVGEPGRMAACRTAELYLKRNDADFIVVNGENAAAGRGITPKLAIDLMRSGVAVITTGDHIWDQKEIYSYISTEPRLLRPINYPPGTPGGGSIVLETAHGPIAVMNVQCRTFMKNPLENPFLAASAEIERLRKETPVIIVDVHGETTSEKIAMGRHLDGKVSLVVGTHTHVQTADERIFPGGTGFLCDAGMCGPEDSILGRDCDAVVGQFLTSMPAKFPVARGPVMACGVLVEVDPETGKAKTIRRVLERYGAP